MTDRGFVNHYCAPGADSLPICGVHRRRSSLILAVELPRNVTCLVCIRLLRKSGLLPAPTELPSRPCAAHDQGTP